MTRVALVTEVIAPYRVPVFNELDRLLDGGLDVIFIAASEPRRDWPVDRSQLRFRHRVLGGAQFTIPYRGDRQPVYLAPPLVPYLERGRYDAVIVGGWNHLECYWSLAWAKARRRRFVLWSETPLLGELPRRPLRSVAKRFVVSRSDRYVVPGPSAARYLEALGARLHEIHVAPNAVDVAFWSAGEAEPFDGPRPLLLYSGRLVRSKGVEIALRAFARSRLSDRATFVLAGDGPDRMGLEAAAPPGARFLGACSPERLRALYHSADMLVFPSLYDPWGLVVNEAAAAGLAAVASDGAGATRDLLRDGENALVVQAGSEAALVTAFNRLADDPGVARRLGARAAEISITNSPEACARGLAAAVA